MAAVEDHRMHLREALAAEHSKAQTLRIAEFIGDSRARFGELVRILTGDDRMLAQRAAWVVTQCAETNPETVLPSLEKLLEQLRQPNLHDAIKRNTMKVASMLEVPDDIAGLAAGIAFDLLASPEEAVAVKANAMGVLEKLCLREPALADELRLAIEQQLPLNPKAAFQARARHVLQTLDRLP